MKVVLALGGNAIEDNNVPTLENQLKVIRKTSKYIADIIEDGHEVTIVHGNGPQVGRVLIQSHMAKDKTPEIPLDVANAMTQGSIEYHLQQALKIELLNRGINKNVISLITQVMVDKNDPAFVNPTKPIGPFYTKEEAEKLEIEQNIKFKEDSGRGWRRVVPSPLPNRIIELETIRKNYEDGDIVISCGGGGIPVVEDDNYPYVGIPAVIDKDFAAEKLAEDIDADLLLILTEVDNVYINFNKPNAKSLDTVTLEEINNYIANNEFGEGSMLPKIKACAKFVSSNSNKKAIITSLEKGSLAINGKAGTTVTI